MKTATIMLSLGGDQGNQVSKSGVTPSEIAVLRAIHGDDSVTDIQPLGEDDRKSRDDIVRLREVYGMARDANGNRVVDALFPGVGARAVESFDDLDLPEEFFKPIERVAPDAETDTAAAGDKPLDKMSKAELVTEAKKRGVDIDPSDSKAEILASLTGGDVDEGTDKTNAFD